MGRVQTLQRRNIILGILAIALGAFLLTRPSGRGSVAKESFARLAPDLTEADVSRIELTAESVEGSPQPAGKRIVLQRESDGSWVVDSAHRYPALQAQVQGVLDALVAARNRGLVTTNKSTFSKYASADGWTRVRAMKSGGHEVANFALGRDDRYPDSYLRVEINGAEQIIRTRGVPRHVVTLNVVDWISRNVWEPTDGAETIRLDIDQRVDKRVVTIVRRGESPVDVGVDAPEKDEADTSKVYWMASPQKGDVEESRVKNLAQAMSGLLIEDIAAGSTAPEDLKTFGLDEPEVVVTLKQRIDKRILVKTLFVGKTVEDEPSDDTPPEPGQATKGRRYVRCDGKDYVFIVRGDYGVNEFRLDPLDLLIKKKDESTKSSDDPNDGDAPGGETNDGAPKDNADKNDVPKKGASAEGDPKKEDPKKDDPKKDDAHKSDADDEGAGKERNEAPK